MASNPETTEHPCRRDEEQDAFDALSEGAQAGDRGQAMEYAISSLEEASSVIDDIISALNEIDMDNILFPLERIIE